MQKPRKSHSSIRASNLDFRRVAQAGGFEVVKTAPSVRERQCPWSIRARLNRYGFCGFVSRSPSLSGSSGCCGESYRNSQQQPERRRFLHGLADRLHLMKQPSHPAVGHRRGDDTAFLVSHSHRERQFCPTLIPTLQPMGQLDQDRSQFRVAGLNQAGIRLAVSARSVSW